MNQIFNNTSQLKNMDTIKEYWRYPLILGLMLFVGNVVNGQLAIAIVLVFGFMLIIRRLAHKNKIYGSKVLASIAIILIGLSLLPIWGKHPGYGVDESGNELKYHSHYLWDYSHIH